MSFKNYIKNIFYQVFKKDSHYYTHLNKNELNHRKYIGDKWDEIGKLQFDFLINEGLKPHHKLIDIGCGSLRGGIHFIKYLDKSNYFGTDINKNLIKLGITKELSKELKDKVNNDNFIVSENFNFNFNVDYFDFAIALSVFTHLRKNNILKCLENLNKKINKGAFYSTFFIVKNNHKNKPFNHTSNITSYSYKDPFHYTIQEIEEIAFKANFECSEVKDFLHPRNQKMIKFIKKR